MFGFSNCTHEPDISKVSTIGFNEITSIVNIKCASCHGVSEFLIDSAKIIDDVLPYKPYSSKLFTIVTNTYSANFMPPLPNAPLDASQRQKIYFWILQGANPNSISIPYNPNDTLPVVNDLVSFVSDVLPIYVSNCSTTGCHDQITKKEGYDLTSYSGIRQGIVPNNINASKLYTIMNSSGEKRMPPAPQPLVSQAQKTIIQKWINEGAKNTNFTSNCDTTKFAFTDINQIIQSSCVGCHNSASAGGGIQLTSYNLVKVIADNGRLVAVITNNTMPKGYTLIDCKKTQIRKWVNAGSLNN